MSRAAREPSLERMLTSRLYAWSRAHVLIVDTAIMLGILVTFGLASAASVDGPLADIITVVTIALLAVRRRWPVAVMVITLVLSLVQVASVSTLLPANVAQLFVIYTVAAHVPSFRTRLVALGLGFVGSVLGALRFQRDNLTEVVFSTFILSIAVGLVWVVGNLIRGRESIIEQLSESNAILRRDREQRDLIAAQGERAKMAREMHDIVAHSLSVVVVQAHGAAYAAEHAERWERADATRTLETIAATARSALAETRRVVGVLRDPGSGVALTPVAGLADLDNLLAGVRSSGLRVTTGAMLSPTDRGGLTRDVDLAAYRVVQESLTNVLKHAGTRATAHVAVERIPGALRISVFDDGQGDQAAGDGLGNGIVGMRERVAASGGQLLAGPRASGGFAVTATIPVVGAPDTGQTAPLPPSPPAVLADKAFHP